MGHRRPDVRVLGRERLRDRALARGVQIGGARLGQGEDQARSRRRTSAASLWVELLRGVLADRLEQPVPLARQAEQALLEQRLERVQVGVADGLGSLEDAAVGEDGEPAEEPSLVVGEEVVRPGDRRPQRLLPRVRVAEASQQVEALAEPLEDLRRRERPRTRGGELDRERQVVEAPAELGDLGASARAGTGRRTGAPPRAREGRHRAVDLALDAKELARRDEPVSPGQSLRSDASSPAASTTCSKLSSSRSNSRSRRWSRRSPLTPSVRAIVSVTSAGSRTADRPTQKTPPLKAGTSDRATSIASLVFPDPPGPISVTSRAPPRRARAPPRARALCRRRSSPGGGDSCSRSCGAAGTSPSPAGGRTRGGRTRPAGARRGR